MPSLSAQLADRLLADGLVEFVESRRRGGASWNAIAFDISTEFGLLISDDTVKRWADEFIAVKNSAA